MTPHRHDALWIDAEHMRLTCTEAGETHGFICASGPPESPRSTYYWFCAICDGQGPDESKGDPAARAWTGFLDHERTEHIENARTVVLRRVSVR